MKTKQLLASTAKSKQLPKEEVVALVKEVIGQTSNMDMSIKELTPQLKGKGDMKQVLQLAKEAFKTNI